MKRMQALQPQIKAIAEKYKDDPAKKNQKTMEFMKEHKVNPLGGCLPMVFRFRSSSAFTGCCAAPLNCAACLSFGRYDLSQPDTVGYSCRAVFRINPLPLSWAPRSSGRRS